MGAVLFLALSAGQASTSVRDMTNTHTAMATGSGPIHILQSTCDMVVAVDDGPNRDCLAKEPFDDVVYRFAGSHGFD